MWSRKEIWRIRYKQRCENGKLLDKAMTFSTEESVDECVEHLNRISTIEEIDVFKEVRWSKVTYIPKKGICFDVLVKKGEPNDSPSNSV